MLVHFETFWYAYPLWTGFIEIIFNFTVNLSLTNNIIKILKSKSTLFTDSDKSKNLIFPDLLAILYIASALKRKKV